MKYRALGGTGIEVSAYCLGTMMFGKVGNPDHNECVRIVHAALDAGINFIDTADMYSRGESEEIVGKALIGRRDDVILATKVHFQMGEGRNRGGNSRRWILRAIEDSLRRLRTDWIDLYQIHRPDPSTDIEETLSVLGDLVRQGKVRAFGCSTFPPEQIIEARWIAECRGLATFRTEQPPYSLLARGIETSLLPLCERLRMGVLTWSPLAWGLLTGRYRTGSPVDLSLGRPALAPEHFDPSIPENVAKLAAVNQLVEVANKFGCTLPELAIAFPIVHPAVTSVIVGPRTMEQLKTLINGAPLVLDDAMLDRLDEIVPPGANLYNPNVGLRPVVIDPSRRRRPPSERAAA